MIDRVAIAQALIAAVAAGAAPIVIANLQKRLAWSEKLQ